MIESAKCENTENLDSAFWKERAKEVYSDRLSVMFKRAVEIPSLGHPRDEVKAALEPHEPSPLLFKRSVAAEEDEKVHQRDTVSPEVKKVPEGEASEIQASSVFKSVYEPSPKSAAVREEVVKEPAKPAPVQTRPEPQQRRQSAEDFEEKYNKLYVEYTSLQKERNELRKKVGEMEMRNELVWKKENAMKQVTQPDTGFQLVHLIIVAVISLLLGAFLIKSY